MKNTSSRRGSALLIVLGMMSFIVVSAVAFSAYMRYSRLPSSYLRRTSASRMLVKAALAEAIHNVDRAIGNHPYPGSSLGQSNANNSWTNRVYMGSNMLANPDETVSTLTLEGLAYLPPSCINEVRYFSRRTSTAKWKKLSFDVGRYAYTAVDVSDCFDINRLMADIGRDSSDLGRVTLTSALERDTSGYVVEPEKWDAFMEKFSGNGSGANAPLVSVADLNLAIGKEDNLKKASPFSSYLTDATALVPKPEDVAGLSFVTDSYFPVATDKDEVDISNGKNQPFAWHKIGKGNDDKKKNDDKADDVINQGSGKFADKCSPDLNEAELVQLYDYLDLDSVPLSLALPTVERTPMITGVSVIADTMSVVVTKTKDRETVEDPNAQMNPSTGLPRTKLKLTIAELGLAGELEVGAGVVFPFKYSHGTTPNFSAQAAATITFVKQGQESSLRLGNNSRGVAAPLLKNWNNSKQDATAVKYGGEEAPIVATMFSEPKKISVPTAVLEEEEAVLQDVDFSFDLSKVKFVGPFPASELLGPSDHNGSFRIVEKVGENNQRIGDIEVRTSIKPSKDNLNGVEDWVASNRYVPVIQVWVRIIDNANNNETVDLVPASVLDDKAGSDFIGDLAGSRGTPLLRFYGNADSLGLTLDENIVDYGEKPLQVTTRAYLADDPRFNYAPENLWAVDTLNQEFKTVWLERQRSKDDIFMTTSDAGYLQSKWELTALLNTGKLNGNTAALANGFDGKPRNGFAATPAANAMWNSYTMKQIDDHEPFKNIINGKRGFRINPYSGDERILRAAFANTPLDWWAASTNEEITAIGKDIIDDRTVLVRNDALKYSFSEKSTYAKVTREDMNKLTAAMKKRFANGDWEALFNDDNFWEEEDKIAGVDLGVTLHSVDKDFLRGYWRDTFANRQHLFLIFVRAEPVMMGGGGMGQIPPQLGARAVALVWRDPTTRSLNEPHRTRVLFYRQFE